MFYRIIYLSSISNANNLQSDLNCLVEWCKVIPYLSINISKCGHISFCCHESLVDFKHLIYKEEIIQDNQVCDLDVILSNNLRFNSHICSIHTKALRVLGFLKNYAKFKNVKCFIVYYALVKPIFEFGSVV